MSWERDILSETVEGLTSVNSASLLALQLQTQVRRYLDAVESHAAEIADMRSALSDAERIGITVMRAAKGGRKTIRISDLMGEDL